MSVLGFGYCYVTAHFVLVFISALILVLASSASNQGYFNGSSYVRLNSPLSLTGHIGLSFRTCSGGQLFSQRTNGNSFSLSVRDEGLLFTARIGHKQYDSRLSAGLLDNIWHYVNLQYRLGNLTLSVAGHQQIVANSTYNSEVLSRDLTKESSILIVGEGFKGCLLQGPSIVFNVSDITSHGVEWGPCQMPNGSCTKMDFCKNEPCMRHGTCVSAADKYECHCAPRYSGKNCETDNGPPCLRSPCHNAGTCSETDVGDYYCVCSPGYTGRHCETALSYHPCVSNPCQNNGTCQALDADSEYECVCLPGFSGTDCEVNVNDCFPNPCENGGVCIDRNNNYTCDCTRTGYSGSNCEINVNECETTPCLNGGTCFDNYGGYTCQCVPGFGGQNCEMTLNECSSDPCLNEGTCINQKGWFECLCSPGFTGVRCETNIDDCEGVTCPPNSECNDLVQDYQCLCKAGYRGTAPNCTDINSPCTSQTCLNGGTCVSNGEEINCSCPFGFSGMYCERAALVERCHPSQCKNGGTCNGEVCVCLPGFAGPTCEPYVECADNPCMHASACNDSSDGYTCICDPGWTGTQCDLEMNECPCGNGGSCVDSVNSFYCVCAPGFSGDTCQINIDECVSNPCANRGICIDRVNGYTCNCSENFMGKNCELDYDICVLSPCENNGTCISFNNKRSRTCDCITGFDGSDCEINVNDCYAVSCPDGRVCVDGVNTFTCQCPEGYTGEDCSISIDRCSGNPCHNGTCQNTPGNYTCICPPGITGMNCEVDIDECVDEKKLCNNGICKNTVGGYQCYCTPGYSGDACDLDFDECLSRPCHNNATCINQINSFSCNCTPGYTGTDCSIDIDECESNPCHEGATCVDGEASFTCVCPVGLTGVLCETNIDDCDPSPCENQGLCIDGLNSYTCNCSDTGFEGIHCEVNIDDCVSSQCQNDGTCIDGVKDYTCQCYAGYVGKDCEVDVNECESSPCKNGGTCIQRSNQTLYQQSGSINNDISYVSLPQNYHQEFSYEIASGYNCICVPGVTGVNCETDILECDSNPCQFGGTCIEKIGGYECKCDKGFEGDHCEIEIDECEKYMPCKRGTCQDGQADYYCYCEPDYGGKNCSVKLLGCDSQPCQHNGTCTPYLLNETEHLFNCTCPYGFRGIQCEKSTTMSMTGKSFALINTTREDGYDIQFRFKTTLPNGRLAVGEGITYFILELNEGRLNLQSSLVNRLGGILIGSDLNREEWQKGFVAVNSTHVVLAANEEQSIVPITNQGEGNTHIVFPSTYVGGTKASLVHLTDNYSNFTGCIEDVIVNGVWLLPEETEPFNISLYKVEHGCPREPQCNPNPCKNGGNCTDKWQNFTCDCKRPYLGSTCQYNFVPATFGHENTNNSLVKVTVSEGTRKELNKNNYVNISMFIRTRQQKGDIFYIGTELANVGTEQGELAPADETLIAAEMDGGELLVKIQFNSSLESYVVGGVKLADGNNHLIQVVRTMTSVEVKINGTEYFRKTVSAAGQLNVQVLYLGGLPSNARFTRQVEAFSGSRAAYKSSGINFKGVIQDVQVNHLVVEFFPLDVPGLAVPKPLGNVSFDNSTIFAGVVSDDTCRKNPCLNGGICIVTFNDFWCNCTLGYKGKTCKDMEFCQLEKCPDGSSCKNLKDGYECIANMTFNGENDSLTFTYEDFENGLGVASLDRIDVTYRSRTGGTLVYISNQRNYFSLSVYQEKVTVSWSLDNSPPQIQTFHRNDKNGTWATIVIRIKDKDIFGSFTESSAAMMPDNLLVSTFPLASWQDLVKTGEIKLGGSNESLEAHYNPNDNTVGISTYLTATPDPHGVYSAGFFKGCLGEVRIGKLLLPFLPNERSNTGNATTHSRFSPISSAAFSEEKLGCVLCFESDCQHGGYCYNASESYDCECPPGYEGEKCEVNIDECKKNRCEGNATCVDGIANYTCICPVGFTSWLCDVEIDECASNPCKNGGTCVDKLGTYECQCSEEFTGTQCESKKIITCDSMPCKNGSTCKPDFDSSTGNNFTCHCANGFEGTSCDIPFCSAEGTPCKNKGVCDTSSLVPFCRCLPGYRGVYCQEDINDCAVGPDGASPCLHGGICTDGVDTYTCDCSNTGYEGTNCQKDIDECITAKCGKGECMNREGSYSCKCEPLKCGINCEFTDPCIAEPCLNGGSCHENCVVGEGKYICDCPDGYGGMNCSEVPVGAANDGVNLAIIITPIAVFILVVIAVGLGIFVTMARKKRATRGTYSPSQQEYCNPRLELDNVMKPPPEERLI